MSEMIASVSFAALGTTAQVSVCDPAALDRAAAILDAELRAIDRACSRFRDDSELSALNRAAGKPFPASPLLLEALQAALDAAERTDGDVDPTLGLALRRLGYDRDFSLLAHSSGPVRIEAAPAPGWRRIVLRSDGTVELPRGVELDLGSTAKALAADRVARSVFEATGVGVLASLGGDISVAGPAPAGGWPIRVGDDHRAAASAPGQTVAITSGGLATSSTTVRRWRAGGSERHHILNPRSGLSAAVVWRTVSVTAASCLLANSASTAAIVRGEGAPGWLRESGFAARLVDRDGAVTRVGGWPAEATS